MINKAPNRETLAVLGPDALTRQIAGKCFALVAMLVHGLLRFGVGVARDAGFRPRVYRIP